MTVISRTPWAGAAAAALLLMAACLPVRAQEAPALSGSAARPRTNLPGVTVTAPYTSTHGGYLLSGDFRRVPRMPTVVFPAQALVKDDILSVQPVHLDDDEYLVLQECASADCRLAHVVRVWNAGGALGPVQNSDARIWIRHENKYFLWMQRLPAMSAQVCQGCDNRFTTFRQVSPPMTLMPVGDAAAFNRGAADDPAWQPIPVVRQQHEGSTFVVTYRGGATVRIRRMHAAD